MLCYYTTGESHGSAVIAVITGFPAGYHIDVDAINRDLSLRQGGHGRGGRQKIEKDTVEILSGTRKEKTLGSPITLFIKNRDCRIDEIEEEHVPRPGHSELAGALKFGTLNVREISERASARDTAARTAAGSLARQFLGEFGVELVGFVRAIGGAAWEGDIEDVSAARDLRDDSVVYCPDKKAGDEMVKLIDEAKSAGETLGGVVQVTGRGIIPGLGSCMEWQEKLDGRIARAVMSVNSVKGVEIGGGSNLASLKGSESVDSIGIDKGCFVRSSNHAGGIEGGMTNGEDIVIKAALKPIPTTNPPASSVNLKTAEEVVREYERSDTCAVPAGAIIAEAVVSFELIRAYLEKFGGDSVDEFKANLENYSKKLDGILKKI